MKGEYNQQIPIFSAKKRMGKHLYDYARQQIKINEIRNKVMIYDIKLLSFKPDEFCFKICCSAGTYIRSVANDLGVKLGCGAVLSKLNRTKIGNFNLKDAINPEGLINAFKSDTIINDGDNFLSYYNFKYIIPVKFLAERKKTIYVYKKYIKMLKVNSPLYGYMININKTNEKNITENDILIIKHYGSTGCYIHKSLINFNTLLTLKSNQKLTKFISEINEDS